LRPFWAVGLLPAANAGAQDYPSRQVTIVVPFAAGGGTDILARMVGLQLEQRLGNPLSSTTSRAPAR